MDTQSGTGGSVPHMNQITWAWAGEGRVILDGVSYMVGYGNPGGYNDCLIDSVRQCLCLNTDPRRVRDDLLTAFAAVTDSLDRAHVTSNFYLDLDSHWEVLLRSLFRHNTCGAPTECDVTSYCIISLSRYNNRHGNVVGNFRAPNRIVVMNTSDSHFDPGLQC